MINRRSFNTILLGTTALSFAACTGLTDFTLPSNKRRVVIVGGGFGGATAAKYLKKFSPDTEVMLIEQNKDYEEVKKLNLRLKKLISENESSTLNNDLELFGHPIISSTIDKKIIGSTIRRLNEQILKGK